MSLRERYYLLLPFSIGTLAFLYFCDWRFLNPKNVGWVFIGANSDKAQAFLGWEFFRKSSWEFPLGSNYDFGLLPGNSIAYSDSIPLLAIVGKIFNSFFANEIQYFGVWLLLCFILQSLFAALIVKIFTNRILIVLAASCLLVSTPFFLQRTPIHLALSGHFLILASLYLFLKSNQGSLPRYAWVSINVMTLMVHPYLFFMVFVIYFGYLLNTGLRKLRKWKWLILEGLSSVVLVFLVSIAVLGIPLSSDVGSSEIPYGTHPWNLLSIFNPRDWPRFFDFYPARDSGFDTFSYPGLGGLLIMTASLLLFFIHKNLAIKILLSHKIIVFVVLGLLLFAITNRVGIGNFRIVLFESEFLENKLSLFRSSARMSWPFLYGLILFSIYGVYKFASKKTANLIILVSLVIQFADVMQAPGFLFPQKNIKYSQSGPAIDSLWKRLAGNYERILVVQNQKDDVTGWPEISIIAAELGMSTNSAYLARYDSKDRNALNAKIIGDLKSDNLDQDAIYVVYGHPEFEFNLSNKKSKQIFLDDKVIVLPIRSSTSS
jgi:hypothetical protein